MDGRRQHLAPRTIYKHTANPYTTQFAIRNIKMPLQINDAAAHIRPVFFLLILLYSYFSMNWFRTVTNFLFLSLVTWQRNARNHPPIY